MTWEKPTAVRTVAAGLPHRRFLPDSRPGSRRRLAAPGGLIGMLVLVAAVESALLLWGGRFVQPVVRAWAFSGRVSTEKAPGCDVLCLGDSLVKHGLAPRVIAAVTGRKAYNLAAPAGPTAMTFVQLRRALDAGARPSAVVFDMKPSLMIGGPRYFTRSFAEVWTPAELLDLCLMERSVKFATDLALSFVLTSYRSRDDLRAAILSRLQGEPASAALLYAIGERNWTANDGAHLATPRPGYNGEITEAEHTHLVSRGFFAHRVFAEYARRTVALATGRGIRVYLLLPPFVPRLDERRARSGADAKSTAFVRSLQDRFPGLTVLDARAAGYPPPVFIDPIHLDVRGTLALSADVAEVLRRDLDGGSAPSSEAKRWVRLPAFRERPIPADLEHTEISRQRLGLAPLK